MRSGVAPDAEGRWRLDGVAFLLKSTSLAGRQHESKPALCSQSSDMGVGREELGGPVAHPRDHICMQLSRIPRICPLNSFAVLLYLRSSRNAQAAVTACRGPAIRLLFNQSELSQLLGRVLHPTSMTVVLSQRWRHHGATSAISVQDKGGTVRQVGGTGDHLAIRRRRERAL